MSSTLSYFRKKLSGERNPSDMRQRLALRSEKYGSAFEKMPDRRREAASADPGGTAGALVRQYMRAALRILKGRCSAVTLVAFGKARVPSRGKRRSCRIVTADESPGKVQIFRTVRDMLPPGRTGSGHACSFTPHSHRTRSSFERCGSTGGFFGIRFSGSYAKRLHEKSQETTPFCVQRAV